MSGSRTLAVIPARLASSRLPRKVLREIAGRPMLAWVYEAVRACHALDDVLIAADSQEVMDICGQNSWPAILTSADLASGSDRVHAVAQTHGADIYVNVQADEPLVHPEHISALLEPFCNPAIEVSTLRVLCPPEELDDPNTVKVVTAADNRALYFSRARIPYDRDATGACVWKHLGLYAYRLEALNRFHGFAPSALEKTEKLEQLRFLENDISIRVVPVMLDTVGVDTQADLVRVEQLIKARGSAGGAPGFTKQATERVEGLP